MRTLFFLNYLCFGIVFYRALYLNIILYVIFMSFICLIGVLLVAYFGHCDPLLSRRVGKPDQVYVLQLCTHIHCNRPHIYMIWKLG